MRGVKKNIFVGETGEERADTCWLGSGESSSSVQCVRKERTSAQRTPVYSFRCICLVATAVACATTGSVVAFSARGCRRQMTTRQRVLNVGYRTSTAGKEVLTDRSLRRAVSYLTMRAPAHRSHIHSGSPRPILSFLSLRTSRGPGSQQKSLIRLPYRSYFGAESSSLPVLFSSSQSETETTSRRSWGEDGTEDKNGQMKNVSGGRPADDEEDWRTLLAAFQMYKAAYGDLKVPSRFVVPAMPPWPESAWGLKLGQRVAAIRATGKYINEDESRRKILDEMGFLWRLRAPSPDKKMDGITFEQIYDALETYRKIEVDPDAKTFTVPSNFVVPNCDPWPETTRGMPIGKKLPTIRSKAYLKANPGATKKLKALGFELDGKAAANNARYEKVYKALVAYKEIHGDLLVPQPFVVPEGSDEWPEETSGLRLGARVNAIRSQGTFVKTNPERKKELNDLGFVWELPPTGKGRKRGRRKKSDDDDSEYGEEDGDEGVDIEKDENVASVKETLFGPSSVFGGEDPFKFDRDDDRQPPTWVYVDDDQSDSAREAAKVDEDVYKPPKNLADSLERAKEMAISVGVVDHLTENNRVVKGKRVKNIPWFNDDFGDDFVFEDVVEALTVYKSIYGNFSGLDDDKFVVPDPSASLFDVEGRAGRSRSAGLDVEASARAAAAIAAAERGGGANRDELIAAEIQRMEMEMQLPGGSMDPVGTEMGTDTEMEMQRSSQWPEHLAGMELGRLVKRIRDGSLEVKHLPERKAQLDAIDFAWGDPKYYIDVPFDKAMCAMYAYYLIRGDMFVYEDFVMLDDDPWPRALAGFELGKAVKRIRELQNFFEAYHPDKVRLLRMVEFVWFPELALPLDPNAPEPTAEEFYVEAAGHPFYHINMVPLGTIEKILADGPNGDPNKYSSWYNWDYVRDYWQEEYGIYEPAKTLEAMGFNKLAAEHREKHGLTPWEKVEKEAEALHEKRRKERNISKEEYYQELAENVEQGKTSLELTEEEFESARPALEELIQNLFETDDAYSEKSSEYDEEFDAGAYQALLAEAHDADLDAEEDNDIEEEEDDDEEVDEVEDEDDEDLKDDGDEELEDEDEEEDEDDEFEIEEEEI